MGLRRAKPLSISIEKVMPNQLLKKLVTVELADEAASIIMIGDIGGILREDVAYDLIDGVVAFLCQAMINLSENLLHFFGVVYGNSKFDRAVKGVLRLILIHNARLLSCF